MKIRFVNYNNQNYSLQYRKWWKWEDYKTPHNFGKAGSWDCVFLAKDVDKLLKQFAKEKQLKEVEIYSELFKFDIKCNY